MPADTQQILEAADKVGQLVAQHPAVEKYKQAQKSIAEDAEATRLMNDFNRQLMTLARQEESGMPVTDAQRRQLEGIQAQLASHIKVKALSMAQVEFVDLMRRISDTIRSKMTDATGVAPAGGTSGATSGGPRLVM
jgi:cell fate (sporulation/competence/biofilm development) regulator YlbF (YheA/YmcA/DUF963 family)